MNKLLRKLTAVVSAAAVAIAGVNFGGIGGSIAAAETVGDFTVTGGTSGTDYTYKNNVLTIKTDTPITISGETTTDTIAVEKDKNANITLDGVNIDVSETGDFGSDIAGSAAFKIADDSKGDVTITLADGSENTLKSGYKCAGLQKNGEYTETLGKLTIQGGTGTLTATSNWGGAGIGGGYKSSGSNITITGGTVTASGGYGSAGIGGGYCGADNLDCSGSYITITGGNVTANSSFGGSAGIGGGNQGSGSNITITGGNVTANGNSGGAGIGGGERNRSFDSNSGNGSNITISGGTVTAIGGNGGAGIGGGNCGYGSNITISGGSVKATGAKAIGGGYGGGDAVTPTLADGTTKVFLYQIDNASSIEIDGVEYPTTHNGENSIYPYLSVGFHTVEIDGTEKVIYMDEIGNVTEQTVQTGNDLVVYGGTPNDDYTYSDGVLTINKATPPVQISP